MAYPYGTLQTSILYGCIDMGDIFGPDVEGAALGSTSSRNQISPAFDKQKFTTLIETLGYRLAWSRSAVCPCISVDGQTRVSDPNCPLCKFTPGFIFFRPDGYDPEEVPEIGELTDVQKYIINREESLAVVVRGIITSVARKETAYSQIGDWVFGSFNLTVRPENRIGYYDRITCLDSIMPYSQIVNVIEKTGPVVLRFPATKVTLCRTVDKIFKQDDDFTINENGELDFYSGLRPAFKSRLTVHYEHHPQFLIIEHANGFRDTMTRLRVDNPQTPVGNFTTLPIRAICKFEFLLGQGPE